MPLVVLVLALVAAVPQPALASGVVGTGTPESCTEGALDSALASGGIVTISCGPGPVTITLTDTKTIAADTTIDGGNLLTISGGDTVGVFSVNTGVKFTVQDLTIANGKNNAYGGGIDSEGTLVVASSTFFSNRAGHGGGIANRGTATVTNSTFSVNSALGIGDFSPGYGGGIYSEGRLLVINSTFSGNSAGFGCGIVNRGTLTVTNSTFSGNNFSFAGSAIDNVAVLTVTNSTFAGNDAKFGGAISNDGTLNVTNSTFSDNSALSHGGAISNAGTLIVANCTFFGNNAGSLGGAILSATLNAGALSVINSTFSDNGASFGSGIANPTQGTATLTNSIIAKRTRGSNCYGPITDGGHNIEDGTVCGFSAANGSLSNADPLFDPSGLANNGGATQTVALQAESPAVNAGDTIICGGAPVNNLDQRGYIRPGVGATKCSIGAYEDNSSGPPPLCTGACRNNGQVTVDEILTMVNVAVGNIPITTCEAGDGNHDGQITVEEILTAVGNALNGCPSR